MTPFFKAVELAPHDPILGLNEQYNADSNPEKVNLGVGAYYDERGQIPLLRAVHQAEILLSEAGASRGYLPIDGLPDYNRAAQALLLGADCQRLAADHVLTIQTLGGTGALKIGADFLRSLFPESTVSISNPSWENHRALFERAGYQVKAYPYYNMDTKSLDMPGMLAHLTALPPKSLVILHACCHNPTGLDPSFEQWKEIADIVKKSDLIPFLDIAYQGFGDGLEEDASVVRLFASLGLTMLVSSSFSKSFSLYGERIGALTVLTTSHDERTRVLSQIKRVVRTNYSNPPTHGAAIVSTILNKPDLFGLWTEELASMRERIKTMRQLLVGTLHSLQDTQDFSHVLAQRGMFSYSGLTADQVAQLRSRYGVYAVASGRICVAALNHDNVDYVARAIADVITEE